MSILTTKQAPEFRTNAVLPNGAIQEVALSDFLGKKYVVLFFYPLDFTFVCPTEIIAFSDAAEQFEKLDVQLLGCSVDSEFSHFAWVNTPRNLGGLGGIKYPLLSDVTKTISTAYGVLADDGTALRGLFLIDKKGVVMHEVVNAPPLGRNVAEVLRTVKALQFFEKNGEVCPANWEEGKKGIKADPLGSKEFFRETYS